MALYIIATPIGNLADITRRAADVLARVAWVACEDTRHTARLLAHLGLRPRLIRYDDHVHRKMAPEILRRLKAGEDGAVVSDAGTPGLSDPAQRLAAEAVAAGIPVVPLPGASALLAALVGSGLPMDAFSFLGFLPRKAGKQKKVLAAAGAERTLVIYESPFRILDLLDGVQKIFGDVPCAVARELTKLHEEFIRGPVSRVRENLAARPEIQGEIVLVVSPQLNDQEVSPSQ